MLMMCGHQGLFGSPRQEQPEDRALAIRLFDEGKFSEALPHFSKLCYNFPYDFQMKYFLGACLVETGSFGTEAEKNLVLASSADVPARVNFYLGKLYHGQGNWNNAQRYYNRFRNNAASDEIAELNVDDLISLCFREINPFLPATAQTVKSVSDSARRSPQADTLLSEVQPVTPEKLIPDSLQQPGQQVSGQVLADVPPAQEAAGKDTLRVDTMAVQNIAAGSDTIWAPAPLIPEIIELPPFIDFQINDRVTYLVEDMFRVPEAKNEFRIAQDKERQLDSLLNEVQHLRKQYHQSIKPSIRDSLATLIQNLEYRNLVLNTETGQHFYKSRKMEQEWWDKKGFEQLEEHQNWSDSLLALTKKINAPLLPEVQDTVKTIDIVPEVGDQESEMKNEVTEVDGAEDEISYRVQIGASDKGIPAQRRLQFNKLSKIRTIETMKLDNGMTIYTTGNLRNFGDAMKLQSQVRMEGIKDAFVIAVKNGKRINLPKEKQPD
jgi:hypothetical protein